MGVMRSEAWWSGDGEGAVEGVLAGDELARLGELAVG